MIEILLVLLLNSFAIIGLHHAMQYDAVDGKVFNKQLLWWVKYYAEKYLGDHWSKPFGGCVVCMASVWSLPVYFYFLDFSLLYFIYVPALAGLNRILARLL